MSNPLAHNAVLSRLEPYFHIDRNILKVGKRYVMESKDVYFKTISQVIDIYSHVWDQLTQVVSEERHVAKEESYRLRSGSDLSSRPHSTRRIVKLPTYLNQASAFLSAK